MNVSALNSLSLSLSVCVKVKRCKGSAVGIKFSVAFVTKKKPLSRKRFSLSGHGAKKEPHSLILFLYKSLRA
jgi:hypothetical protein